MVDHISRAALLALTLLVFAGGSLAEPAPSSAPSVVVSYQARDARDRPLPSHARPIATLAGEEVGPLAEVIPQGAPRVLLWFDRTLAGGATLRRAAQALSLAAKDLVAIGEVEVVLADPTPERLLVTRDALVLEQRLGWLGLREGGPSRLLQARSDLLAMVEGLQGEERIQEVARVVATEQEMVAGALDELLARAADEPQGVRFLLWVSEGFDLDPVQAWAPSLDDEGLRSVLRMTIDGPGASDFEKRWEALASTGWVAWSFAPSGARGESSFDVVQPEDPTGAGVSPGAGVFTVRPGRRKDDTRQEAVPEAELLKPKKALRGLAEATGGRLLQSSSGLRETLARWPEWRLAELQSSALTEEPVLLELEVEGARVQGPSWVGTSPRAVARARARRSLSGGFSGELGFSAMVEAGEGEGHLEVRLDLDEKAVPLRLTVVDGGEVVARRLVEPEDETWHLAFPLSESGEEVVVLAERSEPETWGAVRPAIVRTEGGQDLERGPVVRLRRPDRDVFAGKVELSAEVWDAAVARVEFVLDDELVGEVDDEPWSVRIDFGKSRERRSLMVIGYDAEDEELGRDAVLLNAGAGALAVKILKPTTTDVTGWVETEARIEIPVERRLDRLVFYWNAEPVATLHDPPFAARIQIPEERPMGYIRALALLDDGTVAEDVLFMNGPRAGERVDVHLVELYVVVTGPDGRPVRELGREDFRLLERGREQDIADFTEAEDLPLTLGMAVDSSASMFVKLPRMQRAASRFLRSTFSEERDRAFVVDFDSEPRLAGAMSGDLEQVLRAVDGLEAGGRTALWESVVFSLVQLQGVAGRKALVVFSDGADEDDAFPFRSCLQVARRMGVPVYLIFMREEPEEGPLASLFSRSLSDRVDRLVAATGGRIFWTSAMEDLDAVYAEIERELRSQYLLTYYPSDPPGTNASWRDVEVEVLRPDLESRTLSGYWP